MFENRRGTMLPLGLLVALSALALMLAGCGETETTSPEPAGNPFDAARVGADSTLEVMTWNLENFPTWTESSPGYISGPVTRDWVRDIIEGVRPDIVAIMEMTSPATFEQLDTELVGWNGSAASGAPMEQNLAFLYRVDGGLEVDSIYEIFGSYWREFPRSPYVMEATWNGTPIVVIANHLKALGDGVMDTADPQDEETRRRDACIMLGQYAKTELAGRRVFIVGDMNDAITDAAANNVFQNFLDEPDTFRFADMAVALGPSGDWSFPTWPSHIDHILVTEPLFAALEAPGAFTDVVHLQSVFPSGPGAYFAQVSDHLPVIIRLQP